MSNWNRRKNFEFEIFEIWFVSWQNAKKISWFLCSSNSFKLSLDFFVKKLFFCFIEIIRATFIFEEHENNFINCIKKNVDDITWKTFSRKNFETIILNLMTRLTQDLILHWQQKKSNCMIKEIFFMLKKMYFLEICWMYDNMKNSKIKKRKFWKQLLIA